MPRRTVTREVFCMGCGVSARCEVEPPDDYGRNNGTTYDGTPMPGWCGGEACSEQRKRFDATCDRIMRGEY